MTTTKIKDQNMESIRMLFMMNSLMNGGAEHQAFMVADYFQNELGAKVEMWSFNPPGPLCEVLDQKKIRWKYVPIDFNALVKSKLGKFKELLRLLFILRKGNFDVIISYTHFPNVLCALLYRFAGVKVHVWNNRGHTPGLAVSNLERWAANLNRDFVANAQATVPFIEERIGIKGEDVRIIKNGYLLKKPVMDRLAWRKKLAIPEDADVVLMLGNFFELKDHKTLVEAWRIIESKTTNAYLILSGAASYEGSIEKIKALAFDLGLSKRVLFTGGTKDTFGLIQSSDIGVLSTHMEGCPNVVLEYMLNRLPVVATKRPEIIEVLGEENMKNLSEPLDPKDLAEKILVLINNKQKRVELGQMNYERVSALYDPEKMKLNYKIYIQEALAR